MRAALPVLCLSLLLVTACGEHRHQASDAILETEIWLLDHILAEHGRNVLHDHLGARGLRATADTHTNSIIVTGPGSLVARAKYIIENVDVPVYACGRRGAQAYLLKHTRAEGVLAISRDVATHVAKTRTLYLREEALPLVLAADTVRNQIVGWGRSSDFDAVSQVLDALDVEPRTRTTE